MTVSTGRHMVIEMEEFAEFPAATQRYLRRSLDVGFNRGDAYSLWARDPVEVASIAVQARVYDNLPIVREALADVDDPDLVERLMGPLTAMAAFDLGQGRIPSFGAFRFLYERLVGPEVRAWLPAAFCAAAALPQIPPALRRSLLQTIGEAALMAEGWSGRRPHFFPEWVEKVQADYCG